MAERPGPDDVGAEDELGRDGCGVISRREDVQVAVPPLVIEAVCSVCGGERRRRWVVMPGGLLMSASQSLPRELRLGDVGHQC
jgi:hypothetical protein